MKTYSPKLSEIQKKWLIIDAKDLVLGRLAAEIAKIIRGKHKPTFAPHLDCGDNVIVINADKVHLTGKKVKKKIYTKHTNYPGGWVETPAEKILFGRFPERIIEEAVGRMLDRRSPMGRKLMGNLYVYTGANHPHEAQKPEVLDIGKRNSKNRKYR